MRPDSLSSSTSDDARPVQLDVEEQAIRVVLAFAGVLTVVLAIVGGSPTGMTLGLAFVLLAVVGLQRVNRA